MIVFALKYWKLILTGLGFLVLGIMLASAKSDARHWNKLYLAEQSARQIEQAEVRRVRAEQKAKDAEHARTVEQTQTKVTQEVSSEYQARLADLRARYDSLRAGKTGPVTGSPRISSVPGISDPASGLDAEASFNCKADAIQLDSLQQWIRDQLAIER